MESYSHIYLQNTDYFSVLFLMKFNLLPAGLKFSSNLSPVSQQFLFFYNVYPLNSLADFKLKSKKL